MQAADVLVVGGGIAGLATTAWLAQRGARVRLLEHEPVLAAHASGRNAAIFRPLEHEPGSTALAQRSLQLFESELGLRPLDRRGLVLVAREPASLQRLHDNARASELVSEMLDGPALHALCPALRDGETQAGLLVPEAGVLDIHAVHSALAAYARARGAELLVQAQVTRIDVEAGRVLGVQLNDGTRLPCGQLVLAGGAWNASLGALAGAALPFTPIRRHLVQLELAEPGSHAAPHGPVVWRVDEDELYFRPESGGLLASPCDALAHPPGEPASDPAATELLAHKLARTAPTLAHARVRRAWACLRTFAPDGELVVGSDPRVAGLWWLGGLGGRGMAVGAAAAEKLARALLSDASAVPPAMQPGRLLALA